MKVRVVTEFTITAEDGQPIDDFEVLVALAESTVQDIRNRLFGQGFLPDDLLVGEYAITPDVID